MSSLSKVSRYFHTLKHLKPVQVYYLIKRRCFRQSYGKKSKKGNFLTWKQRWAGPYYKKSLWTSRDQFSFSGVERNILQKADWNDTSVEKLWLYNLHYLDDLDVGSVSYEDSKYRIDSWITANSDYLGVGWEPYTLSLRITNLVKWLSRSEIKTENYLDSLMDQLAALEAKVEYEIQANHLFTNAKALIFGGAFADLSVMETGLKILDHEIKVQFLADGGHYERSPMYHAIILWDVCELIHLAHVSGHSALVARVPTWIETLRKGLLWLQYMVHPDGEVSYFNDSAIGIAPSLEVLSNFIVFLGIDISLLEPSSSKYLIESGFLVCSPDSGTKLIADVGNIGPSYQPGHAHAESLSFELSLFDQRFVVNSGTSEYGLGARRSYERSSEAHNCLVISDSNSSDVWSGFRVGKRAHVVQVSSEDLSFTHDGYVRQRIGPEHNRSWKFSSPSELIVTDVLGGDFHEAITYYYFHPRVELSVVNDMQVSFTLGGHQGSIDFEGYAALDIEKSLWCSEFGKLEENKRIKLKVSSSTSRAHFKWG